LLLTIDRKDIDKRLHECQIAGLRNDGENIIRVYGTYYYESQHSGAEDTE
jgi:hypothetical protein